MKLPVIETKQLELEYSGTKSELINNIFKDYFGYNIYEPGIQFIEENSVLKIYQDVSIHGSPIYEDIKTFSNKDEIKLYQLLKDTYKLLKDMGE